MASSIPTLESIAAQYKTVAKALAPYKTGRLRNSIATSYKKLSDFKYQFDLNMVSYGLWWNDPPAVVSQQRQSLRDTAIKKGKWNFVYTAQKDVFLSDLIQKYTKAQIDLVVTQKMQQAFEKGGYSKLNQSFGK